MGFGFPLILAWIITACSNRICRHNAALGGNVSGLWLSADVLGKHIDSCFDIAAMHPCSDLTDGPL
jgi:hypothetical protein